MLDVCLYKIHEREKPRVLVCVIFFCCPILFLCLMVIFVNVYLFFFLSFSIVTYSFFFISTWYILVDHLFRSYFIRLFGLFLFLLFVNVFSQATSTAKKKQTAEKNRCQHLNGKKKEKNFHSVYYTIRNIGKW